jgi:hypothetical protein
MNKELVISKTKDLIAAQSCFPELKALAEGWLSSIGTSNEQANFDKYIDYLKGSVSSIDDCIGFLKSDMGKQIYGDHQPAALKDAEDKKAAGQTVCTCPACQAGDQILKNI